MFTLNDWQVQFHHSRMSDGKPFTTTCKIQQEGVIRAVGVAFCNPVDQFNYNIGRKLALSRALQAIPRDERKPYWDAYYQARGGKW